MKRALLLVVVACGASKPDVTVPAPPPSATTATVETPVTAEPNHPWPATRKLDIVEKIHGKDVADPYRWLEDEHAPEVQAWMKAEDDYTRAALAKLPQRAELEARIKELFYYDAVSAPVHRVVIEQLF